MLASCTQSAHYLSPEHHFSKLVLLHYCLQQACFLSPCVTFRKVEIVLYNEPIEGICSFVVVKSLNDSWLDEDV